jgi:hypothetical protein
MRCFYCGESGKAGSNEHVPSQFLGSRLKTRRVCSPCGARIARELDDEVARYPMVLMPKALADVRSVKHQRKRPSFSVAGAVSATGQAVEVEFSPSGRVARDGRGAAVHDVVEVRYGLGDDLWPRLIAKVALGCASLLLPDDWLDGRLAQGLQSLLWHGPIDNVLWPGGVPAACGELEADDPARLALGRQRHMIGFVGDDGANHCAFAYLFGGQLACALPLPGLAIDGPSVWVLDSQLREPPAPEGYDSAIERMLGGQGWSPTDIEGLRSA